ncbi:ARF-like 2 binding protein BART, putative [Bodo saltans]|uniref:Cilia- and flagella-associated protein 36 n=1 Tax=Bodo saltans TaxID=75058 RepID=A0A0S4JFM0_BODSA|nr:ARF-like 2 binding protein BART, putative [Bodo saltans]|eukprot:CUG89081.1 ARF-like 2 binding protein BART, putative [Bodo saltans]
MSEWIVEAVIQFVKSPLWTVPINNFIDEQCIVFAEEDNGELKFEYTAIFQTFQQLVDGLLTAFINELGVPAEEVLSVCKARMETESGLSKGKYVTEFIEYVTCLDDFRSFKKVMEQRNISLELEAAKAFQRVATQQAATAPPADEADQGETDEERDLRLAIEASLADDEVIRRQAQLEDADLQKALAMSIAQEEERASAQKRFLEDQAKRAAEREEAERIQQEHSRLEAEKDLRIAELEAETLQKRKENAAAAAAAAVTPVVIAPSIEQKFVEPAAQPQPVQASNVATVAQPDVVRVSSTAIASMPSGLAPLGERRAPFTSFRALPSIASQQPTFAQLHSEAKAAAPAPQAPVSIAPPQVIVNKNEPSKEQLEERARQMREHRERLMAAKKAERQMELDQYKATNSGSTPNVAPQGTTTLDETMQLTVQIARRLREDLVGETRRAQ